MSGKAIAAFVNEMPCSGEAGLIDVVDDHAPRVVAKYRGGSYCCEVDQVVDEARYALYLNGSEVFEITCSPWNVEELAVGRLLCAGMLEGLAVKAIEVDEGSHAVRVLADDGGACRGEDLSSASITSCSAANSISLEPAEVSRMAMQLEAASELFHRTGGVHGAALVRAGKMLSYFVDMGRHNAADKLAGWCLLNDVDASDCAMVFSGRLPLEIMEKVCFIGCPVVVACGAPTNQSLDLAEKKDITVVGFAKGDRFNVYTHPWRIVDLGASSASDSKARAAL